MGIKQKRETDLSMIATIHTDLPEKFGIPRQSGLVEELRGQIVFEPKYRNPDALRGIEGFSHLWLLWQFSQAIRKDWQPMVRPPRLGGNTPMGVFATRSPFRPNPIGLSSVRLLGVEETEDRGWVLNVGGVDLMDGTPIYDIKPYLPYTDCHTDATGGFAEPLRDYGLQVEFPSELAALLTEEQRSTAVALLAQDPRPAYQNDPLREYGVCFAGFNIRFTVEDGVLTVTGIDCP
ncbi:MAG: tRNA (N6-threonylcarbamoyladenosine(37)-N6)-methyltransferase TrmO [Clostridia bacterium]|nr:tRNA (N6-threonylcarbamoyladenosine(37)-N6)-methyltransferase TrmO [Clostridia bacterium]